MSSWENNEEIEIFREYLRIPSVHPNIDYGKWWISYMTEEHEEFQCRR